RNVSYFIITSLCVFALIMLILILLPLEDNILAILLLIKIFLETSIYNILLAYNQVNKSIRIISFVNIISGVSVILVSYLFYLFQNAIYTYLFTINAIYIIILWVQLI